ncbi:NlpC/P60 family protein [Mesorhizobium sp.]|uniref:NlpC/P60 family protein n=1 Tax=Mesorhizobium sp. TaxID=1871066 RepID=UPI0025E140DB|nr:NlpC/P60 family protein [Mesorhizobium sp.]
MHWSSGYIGLPWLDLGRTRAGVDCWGLVRLPYLDRRGIDLPSYTDIWSSSSDRAEVAAIIANDKTQLPWREVPIGAEREFDLVLFRRAGLECHVGIVAEAGQMLHIVDGALSCVERFDRGRWRAKHTCSLRHAGNL